MQLPSALVTSQGRRAPPALASFEEDIPRGFPCSYESLMQAGLTNRGRFCLKEDSPKILNAAHAKRLIIASARLSAAKTT